MKNDLDALKDAINDRLAKKRQQSAPKAAAGVDVCPGCRRPLKKKGVPRKQKP